MHILFDSQLDYCLLRDSFIDRSAISEYDLRQLTMREDWKAIFTTLLIMVFLFGMTFFATTATVKASQKVKNFVSEEIGEIHLPLPSKKPGIHHRPQSHISPDTSIKYVNW